MGTAIKSIDNFQVPLAAGTAYTVPVNTKAVFQKFTLTSQEASATRLVTVYKVAPAGTAGATNTIIYKQPVPPGPCTDLTALVNQIWPAGYILQLIADGGTVVYLNAAMLETT